MTVLGWVFYALQETWSAAWPRWLVAAIALVLIYGLLRRFFARRKIQHRKGWDWKQFGFEILLSALMLGFSNLIGTAVRFIVDRGWGRILDTPWGWSTALTVAWQFVAYFILFDVYYYVLHRLLHTRALLWVHRVHHRSRVPDPLTAFSFHPIEGLLTGGFVPIMVLLFDLHVTTIIAVNFYGVLNSVLVHSGHEIFPRWWYRRRLCKWYLSPAFHDRHHTRWRSNFGAFTTIWDRVFGTIHPDFDADYQKLHDRIAAAPANGPSGHLLR